MTLLHTAMYTVPAGRTAIFRSLVAVNGGPAATTITLNINGAGWFDGSVPITGSLELPYVVLNPGDVLTAAASALQINLTGMGSLLDGAPS